MKHTVKTIKLKTGSQLLVINVPNSAEGFFGYGLRSGFTKVVKGKYEIPHLVEHLIFNDNSHKKESDSYWFNLEKNGCYFNATTDRYFVKYVFTCPLKNLAGVADIATKRLRDFKIIKDDLEREKKIIADELDVQERDAKYRWDLIYNKIFYPSTLDRDARKQLLKNITQDDVRKYFANNYVRKNLYFVIAGTFSSDEINKIKHIIESNTSPLPLGSKAAVGYVRPSRYSRGVAVKEDESTSKYYLTVTFASPHYFEEEQAAIKVLYALFSDGMYSKLSQKIRKEGLGYSVDIHYHLGHDHSSLTVTVVNSPDRTRLLLKAAVGCIADIKAGNFTADELVRAKGYLAGQLASGYQTANQLVKWYAEDFLAGQRMLEFNDFLNKINEVTKEEIVSVTKELVTNKNWHITLLGPSAKKAAKEYKKIVGTI